MLFSSILILNLRHGWLIHELYDNIILWERSMRIKSFTFPSTNSIYSVTTNICSAHVYDTRKSMTLHSWTIMPRPWSHNSNVRLQLLIVGPILKMWKGVRTHPCLSMKVRPNIPLIYLLGWRHDRVNRKCRPKYTTCIGECADSTTRWKYYRTTTLHVWGRGGWRVLNLHRFWTFSA